MSAVKYIYLPHVSKNRTTMINRKNLAKTERLSMIFGKRSLLICLLTVDEKFDTGRASAARFP